MEFYFSMKEISPEQQQLSHIEVKLLYSKQLESKWFNLGNELGFNCDFLGNLQYNYIYILQSSLRELLELGQLVVNNIKTHDKYCGDIEKLISRLTSMKKAFNIVDIDAQFTNLLSLLLASYSCVKHDNKDYYANSVSDVINQCCINIAILSSEFGDIEPISLDDADLEFDIETVENGNSIVELNGLSQSSSIDSIALSNADGMLSENSTSDKTLSLGNETNEISNNNSINKTNQTDGIVESGSINVSSDVIGNDNLTVADVSTVNDIIANSNGDNQQTNGLGQPGLAPFECDIDEVLKAHLKDDKVEIEKDKTSMSYGFIRNCTTFENNINDMFDTAPLDIDLGLGNVNDDRDENDNLNAQPLFVDTQSELKTNLSLINKPDDNNSTNTAITHQYGLYRKAHTEFGGTSHNVDLGDGKIIELNEVICKDIKFLIKSIPFHSLMELLLNALPSDELHARLCEISKDFAKEVLL